MIERYDVIATGRGLSTALASALLAQSGKKVLLVEDKDRHDLFADMSIDPLDGSEVILGLKSGYILKQALERLGLSESIEEILEPTAEVAQIVSSRYRVTLSQDWDALCADLKREFSADESGLIMRYLRHLIEKQDDGAPVVNDIHTVGHSSARAVSKWRSYYGKLSEEYAKKVTDTNIMKYSLSARTIEEILSPVVAFNSYVTPSNLNVEQCVRHCSIAFDGMWRIKGGMLTLLDKFYTIIENYGGSIKRNATVRSLVTEDHKITGVLLSSHEGVVFADNILLGARHRQVYAETTGKLKDANLTYDLSRVEPSHWRYSIKISVNKDSLPAGLSNNSILVSDPTLPLEEENYIMVRTFHPKAHIDSADEVVSQLLVTVLVPLTSTRLDYTYLRRLSGRVLRRLEGFLPFIDFNVIDMMPDFRKSEEQIREYYPEDQQQNIPERLHQYYVRGGKEAQALDALTVSTPHSNLYFCGRLIWPSLGTYGEALSGWKAFEAILSVR